MTKPEQAAEPISRTTLSGQVMERLRDGILAGLYGQGEQLNEAELARHFGVSRGPLREAMQRLIQAGLLENRPHRGVFVPELTDEDLADIYFAREAIEAAAVGRIMAAGEAVSMSRWLTTEVDRMAAAVCRNDWDTVVEHDLRFHKQLVDSANSRRLSRMYSVLIAETRLCLHMLVSGFAGKEGLHRGARRPGGAARGRGRGGRAARDQDSPARAAEESGPPAPGPDRCLGVEVARMNAGSASDLVPLHSDCGRLKIKHLDFAVVSSASCQPVRITVQRY